MHQLDLVEDGFRPEPTVKGRTVICDGILAQKDFDAKIVPVLNRLHLRQQSHGLVWDGVAVTFETSTEATLFRMFYEGDSHAR